MTPRISLLEEGLLVCSEGESPFGELILVRHGQQRTNSFNDPLRTRSGDMELSEMGITQAEATAEELSGEPVAAVYSSDLARALSTATCIAARHQMEVRVDPRLREVGVYRDVPAGASVQEAIGADGAAEVRRRFLAERSWDAFPLTEPRAEREGRVAAAVDAILAAHPHHEKVVVVCHGGVINLIVRRVLGVPEDMVFYPAHASISRLGRSPERLGIVTLNERAHLRGPAAVTY
ncbi:MAG: histidine phosphatase family protein [Actinomycetota bacterium]|nr:histidine phosphatase family protein [Actinomycetota bacterium]